MRHHDDDECCQQRQDDLRLVSLADLRRTEHNILQYLQEMSESLMAQVSVEQADLDALAVALQSDDSAIATEIADLEAKIAANVPLTPADLGGLKAAVAATTALLPAPAPAPADVPPVTP